jgi:hypothetical protein
MFPVRAGMASNFEEWSADGGFGGRAGASYTVTGGQVVSVTVGATWNNQSSSAGINGNQVIGYSGEDG